MNIDKSKLLRDYTINPLKQIKNERTGRYKLELPLKEDIITLSNIPLSNAELAKYFLVSERTIRYWKKQLDIKTNWTMVRKKCKDTYYQKTNRDLFKDNNDKSKETKFKKYGNCNYNNSEKYIDTCLKKYGVKYFLQSNEYKKYYNNELWVDNLLNKRYQTEKENNSYGKSAIEDMIFSILKTKFIDVKRQYKSNVYPFACDFYIPKIDTYIEYQGWWGHGKEPYIGTMSQNDIIKKWTIKSNEVNCLHKRKLQYLNAIET